MYGKSTQLTDYPQENSKKNRAMTRNDARMIAEELFKLIQASKLLPEHYVGTKEAADMLGVPVQTLYNKVGEIPHTKIGKRLRFSESALRKYIERS